MTTRCNMRFVRTMLEENFSSDAKLLSELATVFGFATAAASGEPLSLAAGLTLIANTAASAISAGLELSQRFFGQSQNLSDDILPKHERFRALLYMTAFRCYIEAITEAITTLSDSKEKKSGLKNQLPDSLAQVKKEIESLALNMEEAEVTYLFGIRPLQDRIKLFDEFNRWLIALLEYYGFKSYNTGEATRQCAKTAKDRFYVFLDSNEPEADWMRQYLDLITEDVTANHIVQDLAAIRGSLEGWTYPAQQMKQRENESWQAYRQDLMTLPDQKETMYNESFGVRNVFLEPQATYHISGAEGDAGIAKTVPDLARLFGAILSNRTTGEDLIILCGGPGSGKSTLCRVLVSQLAQDPNIYPVFLRLRRLREGSDIGLFIEESLHRLGIINRLSDLRDIPNLVLVLDGFDELVMASRSRLRQFFNMLRDEHAAGPLRTAKILVSGRDTLFPAGDGLPTGSHVISLLPFDPPRVATWGSKWRQLHPKGPGSTFKPELLLDNKEKEQKKTAPLQHLVTWPLTLHLVARVHTAGHLNLNVANTQDIQKAYLYRSILAETSSRQMNQAAGRGRLSADGMRKFLRSLAWEMYDRSMDSMDPSDVTALLAHFFPEATEADMAELADVAVVNCPELTKGEETGFEFIHKSFAEYLVAEYIAHSIELVIFKAAQFGTDEFSWRMTKDEAVAELAPIIGVRLLTEEVQEMLEPMLGALVPFLKGDRVNQVVSGEVRRTGLAAIIDRFQDLLIELLKGKSLDTINRQTKNRLLIRSPLEAYANQCAGYLIIGTAAARQMEEINAGSDHSATFFCAEPYEGAFWQCICLMVAGGLSFDKNLSSRVTRGLSVKSIKDAQKVNDVTSPIRLGLLSDVDGYDPILSRMLIEHLEALSFERIQTKILFAILGQRLGGKIDFDSDLYLTSHKWSNREWYKHDDDLVDSLQEGGFVNTKSSYTSSESFDFWRRIEQGLMRSRDPSDTFKIIEHAFLSMRDRPMRVRDEMMYDRLGNLFRFIDMNSERDSNFSKFIRKIRKGVRPDE